MFSHLIGSSRRSGRVRGAESTRRAQRVQRRADRGAHELGVDGPRGSGVRVVVLSGAGKSFCAGADISWMAKTIEFSEDENMRDAAAASRMFGALNTLPVPLIGRVHGAALGGGVGLAAVCDIVVAEERHDVRVHRGQTWDTAGGHLAVCAREDRPIRGSRALSHRRAFHRRAARRNSDSSMRSSARRTSTRRFATTWTSA